MSHQSPFTLRHCEAEIILLCVRWYLRYALSYRDLEELMVERGLRVDHTTTYRWVQRYAPGTRKALPASSLQRSRTPGEWMRPPSTSKKPGWTSTER